MGTPSLTDLRPPSTRSKILSQADAPNLLTSVSSPVAQPTWEPVCELPFTSRSLTWPKVVPTRKPSPSLSHTTWESEDSVVNTPQSVPTEPSISRQKVDSVSPKPRSPLLCTLVSTRSCKKNPKHKFV